MRKHAISLFLLFGFVGSAYAGLPLSTTPAVVCTPLKAKSEAHNVILENTQGATQLYLLKNTSAKSLWLDHPVKNPSGSAGWSSYLRPGNVSALLLDKKDFSLSCSVISPGKVINVKCVEALSICVIKSVTTNNNRKGSYWLEEDKSWDAVMKYLAKKTSS